MQEIRCPNCGKTFMVDDTGYAQIAQQVRDSEFDRALRQREKDIAEAKERELELARMRQKEAFDQALGEREKRIEQLSAQLTGSETEKRLAVTEAMGKQAEKLAEAQRRVEQLTAQLTGSETEKRLAVTEAVRQKEKELTEQAAEVAELKNRLARQETESQLKAQSMQRRVREPSQAEGRDDRILQGFQGAPVHEDDRREPGTALPEPVQFPAHDRLPRRLL